VEKAKYIFVMVGYPQDVEQVFTAPDGIFARAMPGALAVDMTTSSPHLAQKLYQTGKELGVRVMDAPVSGGDSGARNATLSIMAGGEQADFDVVYPLLAWMGKQIQRMGGAGFGQHAKAANQIALAGATAAYIEALAYANAVGLDKQKLLPVIVGGAAGSWQMANMAPRVLQGDFSPGFFIKHFIKDMKIVQEEAGTHGLDLKVLNQICALCEQLAEKGYNNSGTQALIKYYTEEK
jgi:3-hydroxyisobutyrate dehydrogenase-like beta-hydroxyacid dehydrogenase